MPVPQLASAMGAAHGAVRPWPPTGAQQARKPAGGFIDCPVDYLTLPWWLYQHGTMAFGTLRVWLGTLELVEKRCCTAPEAPVHYRPEELRRLLRVPRLAPVTAGLQQLEELGLLAWSPQGIQFLPQAQPWARTATRPCGRSSRQACAGCRCPAACSCGWRRRGSQG